MTANGAQPTASATNLNRRCAHISGPSDPRTRGAGQCRFMASRAIRYPLSLTDDHHETIINCFHHFR
jgi:hypothetical protein